MNIQIDEFGSLAHATNGGFLNRFAFANQCDDGAVVIGVALAVEQVDAGHLHGVDDGVDLGLVSAFREIWNTFDERGHNRRG